eukprot:TRINITY_DN3852_c0_g1_i2.p1 TRINITY_DN3852_c0_g1~~TRINITY_DN3852_c0_g1_i2.p1  ORF type:complete len:379 (+),score=51.28 TRINITY_DN3852_c0_g1_i2:230-1366(+)
MELPTLFIHDAQSKPSPIPAPRPVKPVPPGGSPVIGGECADHSWLDVAKKGTKRPLTDVTNSPALAIGVSPQPSSPSVVIETDIERWKLRALQSPLVMLVDLDNWPNFFQSVQCKIAFPVAAFYRQSSIATRPILKSRAVTDLGANLILSPTNQTKDSADCALIMLATELGMKNEDSQLIVISHDKIFIQLQMSMNTKRKRVFRVADKSMQDLEAALRGWGEYQPHTHMGNAFAPVCNYNFAVGIKQKKNKKRKSGGSKSPARGKQSAPASPQVGIEQKQNKKRKRGGSKSPSRGKQSAPASPQHRGWSPSRDRSESPSRGRSWSRKANRSPSPCGSSRSVSLCRTGTDSTEIKIPVHRPLGFLESGGGENFSIFKSL